MHDDLSHLAGAGVKTQEDLYAEAMDEIIQMASALSDAIALLHDLDGGTGAALTVLVDNDGRLAAVVMSPCDGDEPRFALDLVDHGASIH